jgi:hypothetical protein
MMQAAFCLDELESQLANTDKEQEAAQAPGSESATRNSDVVPSHELAAYLERDGEFQRVPNALMEQVSARIDELEKELATVTKDAARYRWLRTLPTCDPQGPSNPAVFDAWVDANVAAAEGANSASDAYPQERVDAVTQAGMEALRKNRDHPDFAPGLALTAGAVCGKCGFTYWEHHGHIIACPRCECAHLRAVVDADTALDAKRYRWLRINIGDWFLSLPWYSKYPVIPLADQLDTAIDTAITQAGQPEQDTPK